MLLIIAIVGTTVAPWQLFFQQSYVIDKRITPRFINYERLDLWIGIVVVVVGAVAMMAFAAATFAGTPGVRAFHRCRRRRRRARPLCRQAAGVLFAVALIDASIIGAAAVSLSTAYAIGDVLSLQPFAASQADRRQGLLCRLLRPDRRRRGPRADSRNAARAC